MTGTDQPIPSVEPMKRLVVARIADIERMPEAERWLIDGFLTGGSITVLAASPKTGKTWVALALAVGVASGAPALGRFHVPSPGPVLLFHAEDDSRAVRERIESIAVGQGLALESLAIHAIRSERLRLDDPEDRRALEALLSELRPKLLVLDPLVRLHAGAESYVGHIAELFGYLRVLQRQFGVAILLTHHLAKNRSGGGEAMRGSGDIHAAYDHGATLARQADGSVILRLEHRCAPRPDPIAFRIVSQAGGGTVFELVELAQEEATPERTPRRLSGAAVQPAKADVSLPDQVLAELRRAGQPLSQVAIRKALQVRNETLTKVLRELQASGAVHHLGRMGGWAVGPGETAGAGEAAV